MAENLGGEDLGGPLVAVGKQQKLFDGISVEGECHDLDLVIGGLLISTAAAFNSKNPSGTSKTVRSSDDVDKFLDAVFNTISLRIDGKRYRFLNELASRVRRILVGALTARDAQVTGLLVDGTSIPISSGAAAPFTLRLSLPLSMRDEVDELDGDAYKVGTELLKGGGFFPDFKLVAGNIVLSNGTATLSGLTVTIETAVDAKGDKYYSGPNMRMETNDTLPAVVTSKNLERAARRYLFVEGVSSGPYTMHGAVESNKLSAAHFIDEFNQNRRRFGGDNTGAAYVPLVFPRRNLLLAERDLTPSQPYIRDEATPGNQVLISVIHEALDSGTKDAAKGAATVANRGQPVGASRVTPPSAAGAGGVHNRNLSILGQHIVTK